MKFLFVALFVAAALIATWRKLSEPRKAQIIGAGRAVASRVRDMGRALAERAQRRRYAYRHLFLTERAELSPDGAIVLAHLSKFCYAFTTTAMGEATTEELLRREGRRQVWIEIMSKLSLNPVDALNAAQQDEVVLG